jgi:serine/threonine protein kinase
MIGPPNSALQPSVNVDPGKPFNYPLTGHQEYLNENLCLKKMFQVISLHRKMMTERLTTSHVNNHVFKSRELLTPYSVRVTSACNFYIQLKVRLVPEWDGGTLKVDKLCYDHNTGKYMVKLATKIKRGNSTEMQENEEKFLLFCTAKNLPHIVKTKEVIWEQRAVFLKQIIIQDFGAHGRLSDSMARLKGQTDKIQRILEGILKGVAALHENNIVHYDLKLANVVLDEQDEPFIIDFNLARWKGKKVQMLGTPVNMDPQSLALSEVEANPAHDVWSLGIVMYELLKGSIPWHEGVDMEKGTISEIRQKNLSEKDRKFPEPPETDVALHGCWKALQLDPSKRPTSIALRDRIVAPRVKRVAPS